MMKNKTQHTTKIGMKKKIDLIEPKHNISRVVTEKKLPLKNEIIAQFKALQIEFDALKHENIKNLSVIKNLEEKVFVLQKASLDVSYKGVQTFSSEIQICCNICIYVATCEEQLNWHMGHDHDQSDESYFDKEFYCDICSKWFDKESDMIKHREEHQKPQQSIAIESLYCNYCEETFITKRGLMKHKKSKHYEKVAICRQFAMGNCEFGDQSCWFNHHLPAHNLETENFKCRSCEEEFRFQSDCLKHRKQAHNHLVALCRNATDGTCKLGKLNCWFNREETQKTT